MVKSGLMWLIVVLCGQKLFCVVRSGFYVAKSGFYVDKSGFIWLKVVVCGQKWSYMAICG